MTVSSTFKQRAKDLLANLKSYNADYETILKDLDNLQKLCTEGVLQIKVSPKGNVVEIQEKYPETALKCLLAKKLLSDTLLELSDECEDEVSDITIRIVRAVPETQQAL